MSAKVPPKPSKDVIYVDVDDEITSIIDKVENSPEKVVALVLPKRAASLQSTVNMKLLARSAKTAGKNPVLITSEGSLLPLAGAAGLHVAKNLQSKPEIPDAPPGVAHKAADDSPAEEIPEADTDEETKDDDVAEDDDNLPRKIAYGAAGIGALAAAHEADHPETIDLGDEDDEGGDTENDSDETKADKPKKSKSEKTKVPNFDRFRMMLGAGGVAIIALIIFIILAITVLPKATITIATTSEPVSATFNLNASTTTTALDAKTGAIPAVLEKTDQTGTQQATATGQQNNGTKATGSVKLTNCSNSATTVPAGTGISASGVSFITQSSVSLDSGNFTSGGVCKSTGTHVGNTNITAQSAGSKYNVTSDSFAVVSGVTGSGSASGGTDNIVTVLSQADVESATQKLTSGTTAADFTKAWEKKLSDQGEYVITSTLKATDPAVTSSPAVGQPASTATVTVKVTYTVLTVKKADLTAAIDAQLAGQIDPKKQKLSDSSLDDATIAVQSQTTATTATLAVSIDTTAVPIIDVNNVKKIAKGKKTGDITAVVNNWPGVKAVNVKLSPFWVSKVPSKESKITVILKEVKTSSNDSGQP